MSVGGSGIVAFEATVSQLVALVVLVVAVFAGAGGSAFFFADLTETERLWRPLNFSISLVSVVEEVDAGEEGPLAWLVLATLMSVSLGNFREDRDGK